MAGASPIFVVGASRSGTTLLARMLGRHPDVAYLRESQFFDDLYPVGRLGDTIPSKTAERLAWDIAARAAIEPIDRAQFLADSPSLFTSSTLTAAETYARTMTWLAARVSKRVFIEQTPRNVYYLYELQHHFPDALFLCLVRDPRGVVASQKRRWRQRSLGAHKISPWETVRLWANYHPYTACRLWNKAADCILECGDSRRIALIRYEDLVVTPEETLAPILERAGYAFLPAMLDVPLWGSSHLVHCESFGIVSSLASRWRDVLTTTEQHIVTSRCKTRMMALGYGETDTPTSIRDAYHRITYPLHYLAVAALNPRRARIQFRSLFRSPVSD
jgi:omega-hydroxy-beta-dihydromenaquinone-9 sulfotransferase